MKFGIKSSDKSKGYKISLWQTPSIHPKLAFDPNLFPIFSYCSIYLDNFDSSSPSF